jgi:cytochrome c553
MPAAISGRCIKAGAGLVWLVIVWLSMLSATAADIASGKAKAVQCATCHGADGMATLPDAPNLAGQSEIYLLKALHDYKSGARKNEMMKLMVAPLSDTDLEDLAAYYQSIQVEVKVP